MMQKARNASRKRNRGFEETHQALIATAVRLLSEKGIEALSVSALAREAGLNRTTIYYHFPDRDSMVRAVKDWSNQQLARGMETDAPQGERMAHIVNFVMDNPQLMTLWIDDFIAPGDIRDRYSRWDEFVAGLQRSLALSNPDGNFDAEVYAVMMLAGMIIGPRVFHNSIAPGSDKAAINARFMLEMRRQLAKDGMQN